MNTISSKAAATASLEMQVNGWYPINRRSLEPTEVDLFMQTGASLATLRFPLADGQAFKKSKRVRVTVEEIE